MVININQVQKRRNHQKQVCKYIVSTHIRTIIYIIYTGRDKQRSNRNYNDKYNNGNNYNGYQ